MTDLEKAVARSLRLSDRAAEKLLDTIQRNIETARAELIRSGIPEEVANNDENPLTIQAIKDYVCARMVDDTKTSERYEKAFLYIQDNLRKSTIQEV